jgi:DNA processing protein
MEEPQQHAGIEELWDEFDLPDIARPPVAHVTFEGGFYEEGAATPQTEIRVIDLLGPSPVAIDDLVRQSRLSIRLVQTALLDVEIAGRLERHGGNAVSLVGGRENATGN